MSSSVFPILPLLGREAVKTSVYSTDVLRAWSGKEVRLARQTSSIVEIRIPAIVRSWVQAPSPWAAATELAFLKSFHETMKGSLDTFLLDNSTGRFDPHLASQPTVRFTQDRLEFQRIVPGAWLVSLEFRTVI